LVAIQITGENPMVAFFLTPPGLYYLIGFIIFLSLLVYWQREAIKRELRRWRGKEISIGPLKLERQRKEKQSSRSKPAAGVHFGEGSDFTGAKIKRVAGRDIRQGAPQSASGGVIPGVDFGKKGKFANTEIEDIAGRDLEPEE
jgi:hypothetical protein